LCAGISTFDVSRYVGASLTMIDRHYGHLALDEREHAIRRRSPACITVWSSNLYVAVR